MQQSWLRQAADATVGSENMNRILIISAIFCALIAHAEPEPASIFPRFKVEESLDIAEVPAGFRVGFCLLTTRRTQYVAYFDAQRRISRGRIGDGLAQ